MEGLTSLEQAVLDKLLAGDDSTLVALRAQAKRARLRSRENTGVGFFAVFEVPPDTARLVPPTLRVGDVNATVKGLSHGAGFVLFIKDGHLDRLEGYTYDEPWPVAIDSFQLTYQNNPRKLGFAGSPSTEG
jgi:hypothetical protein